MTVTLNDLQILQNQIDQITLALSGTISGRELSAAITLLEQQMAKVASRMNDIDPRVIKLQAQVNSITVRFKRYASNEQLINAATEVLPSTDQHAALSGSFGIPAASNTYVTDNDPRMQNPRVPTIHAVSHASGEVDEIPHQSLSGAGVLTHSQIENELEVIKAKNDDQDDRLLSSEEALLSVTEYQNNLTADNLPAGIIRRVATIEELSRILTVEQINYLLNSGFLTPQEGDLRYLPIDTPIPTSGTLTGSNNIPLWASVVSNEILATLLPNITGQYNLGSPTKAFNKIYAYQFIDVDGNSIIIKDKHLGYNGTDKLKFGDDNIILEPEFKEAISKLEIFASRSIDDLQHQVVINNGRSIQDIQAIKESISGIKLQASLKTGLFNDYLKSISWKDVKDKPEALNFIDGLSKFKGILPSFTNLPTTGVGIGDFFITTVSEIPNVIGLYSVISTAGDRKSMYRSAYTNEGISHSKLTDTLNGDCHPQYLSKVGLTSALLSCGVAIKEAIGMDASRYLMTSTDLKNIQDAKKHIESNGNPHNLTCSSINAIENKDGAVKIRNLEQLTADNINETTYKLFKTKEDVDAITNASLHINNLNLHWDKATSYELLGGSSTVKHYHSSDRDLGNATGILTVSKINLEELNDIIGTHEKFAPLLDKSHNEDHNLSSHLDTNVTGTQLTTLYAIHEGARKGVQNAHNCAFAGYGNSYGVADSVSRGDHDHDLRYQSTSTILSDMSNSDSLGTIKADENYIYIRVKSGWKRSKLENLT